MNETKNEGMMAMLLSAIAQAISGTNPVQIVAGKERAAISIPGNNKLILLPQVLDVPRRKRANVQFDDQADFIAYVNEHKYDETRMFIVDSGDEVQVTAIIDYHGTNAVGRADWGVHRAILTLPISEEFQAWRDLTGKVISQEAFAQFIEDHAFSVSSPSSASLVEMARTLQGSTSGTFKAVRDPHSGNCDLAYSEATVTNNITVPRELVLYLPVFESQDPITVKVFLSFRVPGGAPTFSVRIPGMSDILRNAVKTTKAAVMSGTSLPVYAGSVSGMETEELQPVEVSLATAQAQPAASKY